MTEEKGPRGWNEVLENTLAYSQENKSPDGSRF